MQRARHTGASCIPRAGTETSEGSSVVGYRPRSQGLHLSWQFLPSSSTSALSSSWFSLDPKIDAVVPGKTDKIPSTQQYRFCHFVMFPELPPFTFHFSGLRCGSFQCAKQDLDKTNKCSHWLISWRNCRQAWPYYVILSNYNLSVIHFL